MTSAIVSGAFSECGRRARNEDAFGVMRSDDGRLYGFAVADGLGGHDNGEVAAAAAITAAQEIIKRGRADGDLARLVAEVFDQANIAVASAKAAVPESAMATTLAFAATDGRSIAWGHCGDTRMYRLRAGALEQLTRDHTLEGSLSSSRTGRGRRTNHSTTLLAAVDGGELMYEPSLPEAFTDDDTFLLCSDGVWAKLSERDIVRAAQSASDIAAWLAALRIQLLRVDDPEQDNATAVAFARHAGALGATDQKEHSFVRRIFGR